jgi:hypothetical protein
LIEKFGGSNAIGYVLALVTFGNAVESWGKVTTHIAYGMTDYTASVVEKHATFSDFWHSVFVAISGFFGRVEGSFLRDFVASNLNAAW